MEVLYKKIIETFNTHFCHEYNDLVESKKENIWDFSNSPNFGATEKHPLFRFKSSDITEKIFMENYGNPMTTVMLHRITVVVERNDEKVSIKLFNFSKSRTAGTVYFRKSSKVNYITYKFDKKDLYFGHITNHHKKRKFSKSVRRNYFASRPINNLYLLIHNLIPKDVLNSMGTSAFDIANNAFDAFKSQIPDLKSEWTESQDEVFYKHYLETRGIKYPNNFSAYMNLVPMPNKRQLKKYKFKLVDTVMAINNLSGDKLKRALHYSEYLNFDFYKKVRDFFGEDFLKQQSDEIIVKIFNLKSGYTLPNINNITDSERKNIFSIFEIMLNFLSENNGVSKFWTFTDHINFYNKIKRFETIKWKSNNIESFNKEHEEWTNRVEYYTKGKYTRIYTPEFVRLLKENIVDSGGINFYPVPLINTEDYVNESSTQNNCVKTYISKCQSFCLSLRKDSDNSLDRATIEYIIEKTDKDRISFRRIQTLGKYNNSLPKDWDKVLTMLDDRISVLLKTIDLELPKVIVDIGDRKFESDSEFKDKRLEWTSPYVKSINPDYNDILEINYLLQNNNLEF